MFNANDPDIITWNMQGRGGWRQIFSNPVGTMALQETGSMPSSFTVAHQRAAGANYLLRQGTLREQGTPVPYWVSHLEWGRALKTEGKLHANNRCSLAVMSKHADINARIEILDHGDIAERMRADVSKTHQLRPVIGMQLNRHAGWPWVFSVHAPSSNDTFASDYAKAVVGLIRERVHSPWILAGDFNCPPATNSTLSHGITATGVPTHSGGNELDYALTGSGIALNKARALSFAGSDHRQVKLDLPFQQAPAG